MAKENSCSEPTVARQMAMFMADPELVFTVLLTLNRAALKFFASSAIRALKQRLILSCTTCYLCTFAVRTV